MGIYFKGSKLGFTNSILYEGKDGYKIVSKAIIKMKAFGDTQNTSFSQECYLTKDLKTEGFKSLYEIASHRQDISGIVEGNKLYMNITSGGAVSKKIIDFDNNTYLASAIELVIKKHGLDIGKKYTLKTFLEPIQTIIPLQIEIKRKEKMMIDGLEKEVFYLEEHFKELSSSIWITEDGEVVKETSLEGLESRKEDKESALKFEGEILPVSSFITFSLIRVNRDIANPHGVKRLRLKLKNIGNPDIIIEDQRQKVIKKSRVESPESGVIRNIYDVEMEVKTESWESEVGSQESSAFSLQPLAFSKYLEDTPEIQSNNPDIKKIAKEIVGNESDPRLKHSGASLWSKALKINKWVYDYLEKKPVDTFSAVDALKSKEGECQSHSNLFAAIARAAGIPTKIISGIVYSEDYKGFLYHAWVEVYVGKWIALDPTFGEEEVDAAHVKLVEGGWEEQLKLLHFIGRVGIEIIEIG
ncbi:MAG: hypothetical protein A3I04_07560 [Nitrospinae bacterium RIFCSPLOWO2_02_FULL_39_110]|nr:MAG: hypothetical protein A2W53_09120 [Nitrospinae bacterium RIFCSPHIGHO2_02_39_11]OGV99546.1 MAG: hypothetical protein A3D97_04870 [Nitrospinae bacterium RIFCSPHIGHO2_12_FULL_39_42]OGV99998.1 MAG: hypothetical protein A3D20_05790 [Nitrospinae bacterium RIFCSPHIGHO2_02_FULL_39_82]OGW05910.1 MAG: hypothetical protein A2Z59_06805 [Nitrospinae bacterium RIFCSPLOWO2_02_39_17]OGW06230.1 MAG: hypothetical protein A3I04_07560 [Nitrospinae bacterium RIFCSPLOWO2_02_FULL_39_110]OGW08645.1 MAG: hypoth